MAYSTVLPFMDYNSQKEFLCTLTIITTDTYLTSNTLF